MESRGFSVESNGLNVIADADRKGRPRQLFWPWFGANVSVLGLSYGAFVLGFGISFWQAIVAGMVGIVFSFLLCGLIALAGKRGSAPTLVLSRAAFGVRGNKLPSLVSWVLTVGWETVLTILATLATATVFERLGWGGGAVTKVIALLVVGVLIVACGVLGFDLIMRAQTIITVITGVLTVVYIALVADKIHWSAVADLPHGSNQQLIGALVFVMTGFGLGWVNAAADYSRYLPRGSSSNGVVGWTTFGGSVAPIVLVLFGLLLAGSSADLSTAIGADPIGALAAALPTWFLVPFVIVAVLGLVGGAVLDIYSSGLALLSIGLPAPRWAAALIDGVVMIAGTIYVVFFGTKFFPQFQGFLITLGVPIAAWCGIMLADIAVRRRDYADADLYDRNGRYGDIRWLPVLTMIVATGIGWGLVTNTFASWLTWQGYLLGPFGLGPKDGAWAFANLGVLLALALGFLVQLVAGTKAVRRQEAFG
ncbi:allantoin permease [Kribbella antibiotica]|uniref:Allantoin permease n=1 Tax=Kribbella antibiotica TaxID=190195 RepID=A0A4R4YI15_9ACTN|nr:allantoin permease [Kribbella antibiotica]